MINLGSGRVLAHTTDLQTNVDRSSSHVLHKPSENLIEVAKFTTDNIDLFELLSQD